ncbi:hypothetical protein MCEZE9_00032 [Candidatus Nanopelagicaceae bacterium]
MSSILSKLKNSPYSWAFTVVPVIGISVTLRNGLNFWGYDFYALDWAKVWPHPSSVFSVENFGDLALAHLLRIDSRVGWFSLHLGLSLIYFMLLILFSHTSNLDNEKRKTLFVIFAACPITMMIMQEIGYFDVITILGAIILGCGTSTPTRIVGAAIMASGNTPQALIATFLFSIALSLISNKPIKVRLQYFAPFALVVLIWIFERMWLGGMGRTEEFGPSMWSYSVKGFLVVSPMLYFYSVLGPLVILIPKIFKRIGHSIKSRELWVVGWCIWIPCFFGIVTTESTRDALCLMAPTFFWFIKREITEFGLRLSKWEIVGMCLLPCFLVWREGDIVESWSVLRRLFFP